MLRPAADPRRDRHGAAKGVGDARLIALLGVLVAVNAFLRIPKGPSGEGLMFILPILAGWFIGSRFAFLLGAFSILVVVGAHRRGRAVDAVPDVRARLGGSRCRACCAIAARTVPGRRPRRLRVRVVDRLRIRDDAVVLAVPRRRWPTSSSQRGSAPSRRSRATCASTRSRHCRGTRAARSSQRAARDDPCKPVGNLFGRVRERFVARIEFVDPSSRETIGPSPQAARL